MRNRKEDILRARSGNNADNPNAELEKTSRIPWRFLGKILLFRIQSWIIIVVLLIVGGFSLYERITTVQPVNLRPIVYNARELQITFKVCDDVLKDNNLEILDAERRMQQQFIEREKVDQVKVRINRASDKECTVTDQSK